jgi:hypothetical protein
MQTQKKDVNTKSMIRAPRQAELDFLVSPLFWGADLEASRLEYTPLNMGSVVLFVSFSWLNGIHGKLNTDWFDW